MLSSVFGAPRRTRTFSIFLLREARIPISSLGQCLVQPTGIEPVSTGLQSAAMTTSAKVALFYLVDDARFELATSSMSTKYSTAEIIILIYCRGSIDNLYTNAFGIVSIARTIPTNIYVTLLCSEFVECPCVGFFAFVLWICIVVRNFFSY